MPVIPDAWLCFERDGKHYPVLLEIDRGTEYHAKFKEHVRRRIEFISSGRYEQTFGEKAVAIVYLTTGDYEAYRQARLQTMALWTREVLHELGREDWAGVFRFASVGLSEAYQTPLFTAPLWHRPDGSRVSLLPSP